MNKTLPIELAINAIKKQKVRTILTMLAISVGISAVIMVFAAGHGLRGMVSSQLESFGTDIIQIEVKAPNTGKTSSANATSQAQGLVISTFKNKDVEAIKKHPNISYTYGSVMGQEVINYREIIKKFFLMGVGSEMPNVDGTQMELGRFFTNEEEKSLSQVAVLGYGVWQDLFDGEDPIGDSIKIKGKKFKVVGVVEEKGSAFFMSLDDMIYIPLETMQKKLLGTDYISFAVAKMKDGSRAEQTQEDLIMIMREEHDITDPNKDDFSVNTMDEAEEIFDTVIGSITTLLVALVCISLVVGGVGIMNIMYVSVAERTFEIGLRKSLGAKNKDVLRQFLFESIIITLSGGILGVIIGAFLALMVTLVARSYGFEWSYYISFSSIIIAVGFSMLIGLIFGMYPARQAAQLDPITALRKE